ncbi:MAG: hypothetical protein ACM37W_17470 [Actinomycetota bacterium]
MNNQTQEDISIILCAASGLPPVGWATGCTPNQQRHWDSIRNIFQALYADLKLFFAGEASPLDQIPDKHTRELLIALSKTYTTLYQAIRDDWANLYPVIKRIEHRNLGINLSTPGECLATLLYCDCWSYWEPCLGYSEFSPKKARQHLNDRFKTEAMLARPPKELSEKEQKKINAWLAFQKRSMPSGRYLLMVIENRLSIDSQKSKSLALSWQSYQAARLHLDTLITRRLHPSQKVRAFKWQKGEQLNISS